MPKNQPVQKELFLLIFDLGTRNLKLGVFKNTKLLASKAINISSLVSPRQLDVPHLQEKYFSEVKSVWRNAGRPKIQVIGAIGIMHGLTLFHRLKKQFNGSFLYSNTEAGKEAIKLKNISREVYSRRGAPPSSAYAPEQVAFRNHAGRLKDYLFYPASAILLGPMSDWPLKLTKVSLSHLGFLNINSLEIDPLMLEFSGASLQNFAPLTEEIEVGRVGKNCCRRYGLPAFWAKEVKLMDLGGDGLIIHELISNPLIGSFKTESTSAIRVQSKKPILETIENGQIPVTWNYLHDKSSFIWGSALSAGVLTIYDYLPESLDYQRLDILLGEALETKGIPPLSQVGIGLPFSRGERGPGWKGKRPHGVRGKKPKEILWQYYLWKESVVFNMNQLVEKMRETAIQRKISLPKEFVMTGVTNQSAVWAKLFSLICRLNLVQARTEPSSLNLLAAANRVLRFYGKKPIILKKGKVYRPGEIYYPHLEKLKKRYQFYLEKYREN